MHNLKIAFCFYSNHHLQVCCVLPLSSPFLNAVLGDSTVFQSLLGMMWTLLFFKCEHAQSKQSKTVISPSVQSFIPSPSSALSHGLGIHSGEGGMIGVTPSTKNTLRWIFKGDRFEAAPSQDGSGGGLAGFQPLLGPPDQSPLCTIYAPAWGSVKCITFLIICPSSFIPPSPFSLLLLAPWSSRKRGWCVFRKMQLV